MFAITGVTGQAGGLRRVHCWMLGMQCGLCCGTSRRRPPGLREIVLAEVEDTEALQAAFAGTEGVFVMVPSNFAPQPGYPGARAAAASLRD